MEEFAHIQAEKILVSFARARARTDHGVHAKTVPLAGVTHAQPFPGGGPFLFRDAEVLYLVYFYLPRFHDQAFEDKVGTIVHELYHMAPSFDGTLRPLPGRSLAQGEPGQYEALVETLAGRYLELRRSEPLLDFLRMSTEELAASLAPVRGLWVKMP